jgi:diacylglycerol kinase family enzyme
VTELAVIVNPIKLDDREELIDEVSRRCHDLGWTEPLVLETTEDDPGSGMTRTALDKGVRLILVCGGDGTVAACAGTLALTAERARGSGEALDDVALALLPAGTGNLLARNLAIPVERQAALDIAFGTTERRLDALASGDRGFVVMAGLGFDAAMMAETSEELKHRIGWPAYVAGLLRALVRTPRVTYTVTVDDGPPVRRRGIGVLIANVGNLQGGVVLLPDAVPDDGLLDVIVLAPQRPTGWIQLLWAILRRRPADTPYARVITGGRVTVSTNRDVPVEYDGDVAGSATRLDVRVVPAAITVRVG